MKKTSIAGQALMEGIMMRGPHKAAMAVRRANGEIAVEEIPVKEKSPLEKIPVVRGVFGFISSMSMGSKTLMRSAELAMEDAEEDADDDVDEAELTPRQIRKRDKKREKEAKNKAKIDEKIAQLEREYKAQAAKRREAFQRGEVTPERQAKFDAAEAKKRKKHREEVAAYRRGEGGPLMAAVMFFATGLGLALAVILFFFLPTWTFRGLCMILPESYVKFLTSDVIWQSVFEGIMKLVIFVVYVKLCTLMKEIRVMFSYHGAEHMSIFCYEAGDELTVENVKKYSRFHPRCGTSFLIIMMILGIITGMFIPQDVSNMMLVRPLIKLAIIPLIMGVGYELLKLCGRYDNILTKIIAAPGLLMQRLTTYKPDDKQIECAVAALKAVIPEDGSDQW